QRRNGVEIRLSALVAGGTPSGKNEQASEGARAPMHSSACGNYREMQAKVSLIAAGRRSYPTLRAVAVQRKSALVTGRCVMSQNLQYGHGASCNVRTQFNRSNT